MDQNLFGTDGIRRKVGKEPFTAHSLIHIGDALGTWACSHFQENPHIIIAHDTRISCPFVKSALKTGLLQHPINVYDAGTLPTPTVFQLLKYQNLFDGGIVISASHNPYYDNGLKIIDTKGGKISLEDEVYISQLFYDEQPNPKPEGIFGSEFYWNYGEKYYTSYIESKFDKNFLKGIKVVLDCANGATYKLAPHIFKKFGAEVITINASPNGTNINKDCGSLHPQELQKKVIEQNAAIGFAFDGDGDRILAVAKNGSIKDGDDILAFLLEHPIYKNCKTIVGTIITNHGLDTYLKSKGISLVRTPVGDKYVAEKLKKLDTILGGEQSGHIILKDHLSSGDGIFVALRIAQTALLTKNWNIETFTRFPQIQINLAVREKRDLQAPPLSDIISEHKQKLSNGRLIVRYSGTENKLRIMVEEEYQKNAQEIAEQLSQKLKRQLL
ncbi:phosphoglucosamine mutase [bacterium]|jgi:phosphoglucosamine mutase|nr:phosphoglucosamine mutase [bacterium]